MNFSKGYRGDYLRIYQYYLGVEPDGIFGNNTYEATKRFQRDMNLPVSGTLNNHTLSMIDRMSPQELPYIREAKAYVGIKELDVDGNGSSDNRGVEIDRMIAYTWNWFDLSDPKAKGIPWCAVFISYILNKAYGSKFTYKTASAREMLNYAKSISTREIKSPKDFRRDEVAIGGWVNANGQGHVYFIDPIATLVLEPSNSGFFRTIEGNTNSAGAREGDSVYMKKRTLRSPSGSRAYSFRI